MSDNAQKPNILHLPISSLLPNLESVYKDIHSHPELLMQENRTAGIAADCLRAAGYEVTTGDGLLRNGDGPSVMLRADMDALPVQEATQIAQILGKHLVSVGLQMRCFGATDELPTLTKQTRIDQCERVRVN